MRFLHLFRLTPYDSRHSRLTPHALIFFSALPNERLPSFQFSGTHKLSDERLGLLQPLKLGLSRCILELQEIFL